MIKTLTGKYNQPKKFYLILIGLLISAFLLVLPGWSSDRNFTTSSVADTNTVIAAKLSLKAAFQLAIRNNHQVKAFAHSVSSQREDIGIAQSNMLPKIAFEEGLTRTDTPAAVFANKLNQGRFSSSDLAGAPGTFNEPGFLNNWQTAFSIEQPIFSPKTWIGTDISKKEFQAKTEDYERFKEQIAYNVAQTYLMVQTAREFVAVAKKAVEDTNEHLRISNLRYDSNLALYSDTLRASTAHKEAQQRQVTAEKNLELAKRQMGLLLGIQESVDVDEEVIDVNTERMEYYASAALSRKDLKAMQNRIESAKRNVDMATAEYLPIVGLRAAYEMDDHTDVFGSEGSGWMGAIFLKWYLFDGTRRDHLRAKARYEVEMVKENFSELQNAISYRVFQAYLTLKEAGQNVQLARSALVTAEEGVRLVRKRYENSLSPLVDLLDSQMMLDNVRSNMVARENENRLAAVNLAFESGTIMWDFNLE